jgi:hypothetical protein
MKTLYLQEATVKAEEPSNPPGKHQCWAVLRGGLKTGKDFRLVLRLKPTCFQIE